MPEAATGGVLWENMFLEISQNSQENTCARVGWGLLEYLVKGELQISKGRFVEVWPRPLAP